MSLATFTPSLFSRILPLIHFIDHEEREIIIMFGTVRPSGCMRFWKPSCANRVQQKHHDTHSIVQSVISVCLRPAGIKQRSITLTHKLTFCQSE